MSMNDLIVSGLLWCIKSEFLANPNKRDLESYLEIVSKVLTPFVDDMLKRGDRESVVTKVGGKRVSKEKVAKEDEDENLTCWSGI